MVYLRYIYMTILQPDTLVGHSLNYIKRYDLPIDRIALIDEHTNTTINVTYYTETEQEYYFTIDFEIDLELVSDRYYMFQIYDASGAVLYRDKCFCTAQVIDEFSVNLNTYDIDQGTDNEYIIYE